MTAALDKLIKSSASTLKASWALADEPSWCPLKLSEKQQTFLDLPHREALYGGGVGGGKSVALLAGALQHVHIPNYSALLLRRTFPELSQAGGLMAMAHEWLTGTAAKWNDRDKKYTFPSGSTLTFGFLEVPNDKYRYQGSEFQFVGWDELTQFEEDAYIYLFSRNRKRHTLDVPLRIRGATNPGNIGSVWVMNRFIPEGFKPENHADQIYVEKWGVDGEGEPVLRAFVPALLGDNPGIEKEEYLKSLAQLDPVLKAQLLRGDWTIQAKGDIFPEWDERRHVISWSDFARVVGSDRIPSSWLLGVGLDWGSTEGHPYVVSFLARAPESSPLAGKVFLYRSLTGYAEPPRLVAERIKDVLQADGAFDRVYVWLMSHEAKSERDTFVMDHGLPFGPWKPDRTAGIAQIRDFLQIRGEQPDVFHPEQIGSPAFYAVVADEERDFAKTDAGLARHRTEFPLYHYDSTGFPFNKRLNDAMDSLRGVAAAFFPPVAPLTEAELLAKRIQEMGFNEKGEGGFIDGYAEMSARYKLASLIEEEKTAKANTHPFDRWLSEHEGGR